MNRKILFAVSLMITVACAAPKFADAQETVTLTASDGKLRLNEALYDAQFKSLKIGLDIPMADVKMKSTDGKEISLHDKHTNKGLLVMFSCNTCPYVVKAQARTKEAMEYTAKNGIGMVIVNSNAAKRDEDDSYNAMVKYAKSQGYKVPYVVDENAALADAFGAARTPEVFLFDGSGKLVYKGAMEDNPSNSAESKSLFLKNAIDNMLSKKPIDPAATKSIGCTIKRNN